MGGGVRPLTASSGSVLSLGLSASGWALWPLGSCWGSVGLHEEPLLSGPLLSSLSSVPVQGESPVNGWVWRSQPAAEWVGVIGQPRSHKGSQATRTAGGWGGGGGAGEEHSRRQGGALQTGTADPGP